jgi:hypothetical protein
VTRRSGAQDDGAGAIARPVIARRVSAEAIHVSALRRLDRFAPLAMTGGARGEFVSCHRNARLHWMANNAVWAVGYGMVRPVGMNPH